MEMKSVAIEKPSDVNVIIGGTHFIKSVEDIYEAVVSSVPGVKFGLAFCEASGPCLIRCEGTDEEMVALAKKNALALSAGHTFVVFLKNAFPINVLNAIKNLSEVTTIFCATANPVEVIIAENERGRGILGVIDGGKSKGVETDKKERHEFIRKIGYKF